MSPFARTCQASYLLSGVIAHLNANTETSDRASYYEHAIQLHSTLTVFCNVVYNAVMAAEAVDDGLGFVCHLSSAGIGFSAAIALYFHHSCAESHSVTGVGIPEQLNMQQVSLTGFESVVSLLRQVLVKMRHCLQLGQIDTTSCIFMMQSLYESAKICALYANEVGSTESMMNSTVLLSVLEELGEESPLASKLSSEQTAILLGMIKKLSYIIALYLQMLRDGRWKYQA